MMGRFGEAVERLPASLLAVSRATVTLASASPSAMLRLVMESGRARRSAPAPLELLAAKFRLRVARGRRQLGWGGVLLALVIAAHLARRGTLPFRLVGAVLLLGAISTLVFAVMSARRTLSDRRRLLAATLLRAEPVLGARALRALSLVERAERPPAQDGLESVDLAQLHFQRVLAQAPSDLVERWATRVGDRARLVLLAVVVAAGAAFAFEPARVVEGLDVLLALGGRAPVPMTWLSSLRVESRAPAYLRSADHGLLADAEASEPAGSTIVVQGVPEREGRQLVLLGAGREVPFVSDGMGGVVARWLLTDPVELRAAARFGQVLIVEPQALKLRPVADLAPRVELEGAPRQELLKDLQALELRYSASDDHGLREVALVMRAGGREERRTLERLDGEAKQRTGAQALSPRDTFLRRSFLPVEITIEARDNDATAGAKWGKSLGITLVPPGVGEAEATRLAAFRQARAALLAAYASAERDADAASKPNAPNVSAEARSQAERAEIKRALEPLVRFVDGSYAGAAVPRPLKVFLQGQARSLERPAPTRETYLRRLEDVLLAVDAALRATGNHDAESVSKRLGDVAEEVAEGCKIGIDPEKRKAADKRLWSALGVLSHGADALSSLSDLGADLGGVAQGEIRRVQRGLSAQSYLEAELAARHLAARLRRPKPSFSSAGGGVESGGQQGRGRAKQPGEASQAHQQFEELMRELQQLSEEHAGEVGAVENALESAQQAEQDPELVQEANQRAAALRRAFESLPDYAPGASKGEAAASLAREHGRAMAESLSRLSLRDAAKSAESAKQQLKEAKRAGDFSSSATREDLERAEQELDQQRAWLDGLLEKANERESAAAKQALENAAKREHDLAERAQNLSGRGSHGEAALPGEVVESLDRAEGLMREAAQELKNGRGERGLSLQRDAQRLLDQQEQDKGSEEEQHGDTGEQRAPESGHQDSDRGSMRMDAGVPGRDKNQRADEFRKRVLEGLSRDKGGRLGPAVKRYAEGLLK